MICISEELIEPNSLVVRLSFVPIGSLNRPLSEAAIKLGRVPVCENVNACNLFLQGM